jgi:hypothetical protein
MSGFIDSTFIVFTQIRTSSDQAAAAGATPIATSFSALLNIFRGFLLEKVYTDLPFKGAPHNNPHSLIKSEVFPKLFFNHDIPIAHL